MKFRFEGKVLAVSIEDHKSATSRVIKKPNESILDDDLIQKKYSDLSIFENQLFIAYLNQNFELIIVKIFRENNELKFTEMNRMTLTTLRPEHLAYSVKILLDIGKVMITYQKKTADDIVLLMQYVDVDFVTCKEPMKVVDRFCFKTEVLKTTKPKSED